MNSDLTVALVYLSTGAAFHTNLMPVDIAHAHISNICRRGVPAQGPIRERLNNFINREMEGIKSGRTLALEIANDLSLAWFRVAIYKHPGETFEGECVCLAIDPLGGTHRYAFSQPRCYVRSRIRQAWGLSNERR